MKKTIILGFATLLSVLASCGGKSTSETKLHVIFDNPAPRTMPLALFGEVPDSLVTALNIAEGIPSSVSVILLEKDGQQMLFEAEIPNSSKSGSKRESSLPLPASKSNC